MKNLIILLAFVGVFSCNKSENAPNNCEDTLNCTSENCVFTINNATGTTIFLSCYNSWGIYSEGIAPDDGSAWLIVDNWDSSFEDEGIEVKFCGYVRENTLPLQFPDPNVGVVYQIKLVNVELD